MSAQKTENTTTKKTAAQLAAELAAKQEVIRAGNINPYTAPAAIQSTAPTVNPVVNPYNGALTSTGLMPQISGGAKNSTVQALNAYANEIAAGKAADKAADKPVTTVTNKTVDQGAYSGFAAQLAQQYPDKFDAIKKMTAAELAAMYGIMYKREDIEGVLNEATAAKFNELESQTRKLRDQQLTDYAAQYNQYLLNTRQNRQNAMRSGMSRGTAAAQDIMSQMSVQQQGATNQAAYQQGLADLVNQRGTQLGADKYNALAMSNDIGQNLANIGANFYQSDAATLTGYQQYLASLANAQANAYAANTAAGATKYAADAATTTPWGNALAALNLSPEDYALVIQDPTQLATVLKNKK